MRLTKTDNLGLSNSIRNWIKCIQLFFFFSSCLNEQDSSKQVYTHIYTSDANRCTVGYGCPRGTAHIFQVDMDCSTFCAMVLRQTTRCVALVLPHTHRNHPQGLGLNQTRRSQAPLWCRCQSMSKISWVTINMQHGFPEWGRLRSTWNYVIYLVYNIF